MRLINHQIGVWVVHMGTPGIWLVVRTNVLDFSHDDITEELFCPATDLQDPHQSLGNFVLTEEGGEEGREVGRKGGKEGARQGEGRRRKREGGEETLYMNPFL